MAVYGPNPSASHAATVQRACPKHSSRLTHLKVFHPWHILVGKLQELVVADLAVLVHLLFQRRVTSSSSAPYERSAVVDGNNRHLPRRKYASPLPQHRLLTVLLAPMQRRSRPQAASLGSPERSTSSSSRLLVVRTVEAWCGLTHLVLCTEHLPHAQSALLAVGCLG